MGYYEFQDGNTDIYGNQMTPGVYMLVDNAYSDAYSYLSNGLEPDAFEIYCAIPLENGYDDEWYAAIAYCGVPMD